MIRRALEVVGIFGLAVNGLILPPGIAAGDDDGEFNSVLDPKSRSIRIHCSACTFPPDRSNTYDNEHDDNWVWIQGGSNDIELNFHVSDDGESLELNGQSIFPHQFRALSLPPIYVNQVSTSAAEDEVSLEITSSAMRVEPEQIASAEGDIVLTIKYQIMALRMQEMQGLPEVAIDLLKTTENELFILKIESLPSSVVKLPALPHQLPNKPDGLGELRECKLLPSFVCKFKQALEKALRTSRIQDSQPSCKYRPRLGHPPHHRRPHFDEIEDSEHSHMRPHHPSPHDHHHRHYHHHRHHVLHAVLRGMIGALIPILAGITVGLSVSFLGLAVGRAIGCLYNKMAARRRNGGYQNISLEEADFDEGKMLAADEEADTPPAYENAPAYEEVEHKR